MPAILYGPEIKNIALEIQLKEFEKIYKQAGKSSLISLKTAAKNYSVLIHKIEIDPLTNKPLHVDFYQPILTQEVEALVPLVFEGESLAVKDLGGTLIKEIQEIEVRALPEKLPHEIRVNISNLKTFEDEILIKDLNLPEGVRATRGLDEIVALAKPAQKVEEELEKPIEEEVEKVEKAGEKKKEEEATVSEEAPTGGPASAKASAGKEKNA